MSVINKMLRDLDKRQQQPGQQPAATAAAQMPSSGIGLWWLVIIMVALLLAVIVAFAWQLNSDKPVLQPQVNSAQPASPELEPTAAVNDGTAATATALYSVTPAVSPQNSPTVPAEVVDDDRQLQTEPTSTSAELNTLEVRSEAEQPPIIEKTTTPTVAAEQSPQVSQSTESPKSEQMSVEQVQLSPNELAEKKYQAALDSLQKERPDSAEQLFKDALALNPEHIQARSRLAALWYGRGNGGEALQVLARGVALLPQQPDWRLLQARIQRALSDDNAALASLQQVSVAVAQMPDVFILRATLAQQLGQYQQALQDYQRLHQWQPDDARWLLGAGVASEYLEQPDSALSYYQRGLAARELSQSLQQFMQQRVQQLEEQGE
ncbi:tetratricopeptide repeat protein [Idiomarina xiamenensis]|uniref:Uncharacterized protein n=1 Tax=Idiomarina xiamenensis 10-D-4 TaxID=740709 RepID=K2JPG9_9GAMM|nr:tetratricopeptide repeat protein [Idiomarina xiamenensis]EKE85406.1 hypothetical protein A10D4_03640 [Idiomarina xiamenensis 10-D-4]